MNRQRPGDHHRYGPPAVFLLMLLLVACQGGRAGPASTAASRAGSPAQMAQPAAPTLAAACSGSPCPITAGTYRLGPGTVLPGLEVTVPAGWLSTENTPGELTLVPPGQPDNALKLWLDMVAVKSSGTGHGTTILKNVGTTPKALISWLTHDPDFLIVSKPAQATIGGITMTSLVVGVSRSANYGDPGCPANPRCADLFTNSYWGSSNFYGIGGDEEVRLYLATIQIAGRPHTFFVALDAGDHAGLARLAQAAGPVIQSMRLPSGATGG